MSVYQIHGVEESPDSIKIVESIMKWDHKLASQVVYRKSELVDWVFDYDKSHFSVSENRDIFRRYPWPDSFKLDILRRMCWLVDKDIWKVKSLISGFKITSHWKITETKLSSDSSQSKTDELALLLYWLAEWAKTFVMDDDKDRILWDFFGNNISSDAFENPDTEYQNLRALMTDWKAVVEIM
jgi:hypothetical protein